MGSTGPNEPRFHVLAQLEHLQSKYTGTGHADVPVSLRLEKKLLIPNSNRTLAMGVDRKSTSRHACVDHRYVYYINFPLFVTQWYDPSGMSPPSRQIRKVEGSIKVENIKI